MTPETRYARNGTVRLAYQVVGQARHGLPDIVLGLGWISHLEYLWDEPAFARFVARLAARSRVILFDKRGTGLSDPVGPGALPTTEERVQDIRAVLDAAGCEAAILIGISESGALAAAFAAAYPERTQGLIVVNGYARRLWAPDYPWGPAPTERQALYDRLAGEWNDGIDLSALLPSVAADEVARRRWDRLLRRSASPGAARAMAMMNAAIDVRASLAAIRCPALILHRAGDRAVSVENGRYLAEHVPNAAFVELPGADHLPFAGDQDAVLDQIEAFLRRLGSPGSPDERVLTTLLAVEVVEAAEQAVRYGDRRWGELRAAARSVIRREIGRGQGRVVTPMLDGALAAFAGPGRAIDCARAILAGAAGLDLPVRAGVHAGEVAVVDGELTGVALYLAQRIMIQAGPGDALVSGTVHALVAGADLEPEPACVRAFSGLPGEWELYRLLDVGAPPGGAGAFASALVASPAPAVLSRREREIAALLAQGLSNREIASELVISVATAERHVANVLAKLGFRSRTQVAAWAVEHGVLRPPTG